MMRVLIFIALKLIVSISYSQELTTDSQKFKIVTTAESRMYIEVNKIDTKNPQLTSLVEYNNNIRNALAAYNGGPTNYLESRQDNYQKSVLKKLSDYRILINFNTPIFE